MTVVRQNRLIFHSRIWIIYLGLKLEILILAEACRWGRFLVESALSIGVIAWYELLSYQTLS